MRRAPSGLWLSTLLIVQKDLRIEWRSKARVAALGLFSLSSLFLFSFASGADTALLSHHAGGYLWLSLLFASTLGLNESMRIERENAALEGLRLLPLDARALFLGKAFGNALLLWLLGLLLLPLIIALFAPPMRGGMLPLVAVLGLGSAAVSAPGTLYAAIAGSARGRDALLPLLLFPLLMPALLAAVEATGMVFEGDPMVQLPSWMGLLAGFDLIYWSLGFVLFPSVIED